jgi:hypothetical protein
MTGVTEVVITGGVVRGTAKPRYVRRARKSGTDAA